jgi:hypothetical protein
MAFALHPPAIEGVVLFRALKKQTVVEAKDRKRYKE